MGVLARHRVAQEAQRLIAQPPQHVAHIVVGPDAQTGMFPVWDLEFEEVGVLFVCVCVLLGGWAVYE